MSEKSIDLDFGALALPLLTQLIEQDWNIDSDTILHWQKDSDAITRCVIRGYIPDSAANKARGRLFKQICEHCGKLRAAEIGRNKEQGDGGGV